MAFRRSSVRSRSAPLEPQGRPGSETLAFGICNPSSQPLFLAHPRTPPVTTSRYRHVNYLWDDAVASKLDPVGRLVYRSNMLGADQRVTNTGGGNTSAKLTE